MKVGKRAVRPATGLHAHSKGPPRENKSPNIRFWPIEWILGCLKEIVVGARKEARMIKILLADDHDVMRQGLANLLENEEDATAFHK